MSRGSTVKELRTRLTLLWMAAVIVIAACGVVYDVTFTASTASLWLVAAFIPPTVVRLVWPNVSLVTIAEAGRISRP